MKALAVKTLARGNVVALMALVPLKVRASVERIARRKRVPLAAVVRAAIEEHVARTEEPKR